MKITNPAYTFNAASKTVTFTGYGSINLNQVLAIINVTAGVTIYNPTNAATKGSVSTNVLTLVYDTTSMNNADALLIMFNDPAYDTSGQTTDAAITSDSNGTVPGFLRGIVKILASAWDSANGLLNIGFKTLISLLDTNGNENDTIGIGMFRRADAAQNTINFAANSAQTVQAGTTSKSIYITDLIISSDGGAACSVIIQDDAGTPNIIINKIYFGTTPWAIKIHFLTPKKLNSGAALKALCSSATPNITVDFSGYVK